MCNEFDPAALDWDKVGGLMPTIVQDATTLRVLMLGYMDHAALDKTMREGKVTFFSRTKQRLWTKGETSGNHLELLGTLEADVEAAGLVSIRPGGHLKGTVRGAHLQVEEGGGLSARVFIWPQGNPLETGT